MDSESARDEIEITRAMIEAGRGWLIGFSIENDSPSEVVRTIYLEMERARLATSEAIAKP